MDNLDKMLKDLQFEYYAELKSETIEAFK